LRWRGGCDAVRAGRGRYHKSSKSEKSDDDLAANPGRDALRQIVQNQCVVNWSRRQDPAPCERVYLADSKTNRSGYAVLADAKGGAHYLLIPVQTMTGLDGNELLDPDTPNYFAEAWRAHDLIDKFVGHQVPRSAIGLVVNKAQARSQDQFHIHIECLRQDAFDSLRAAAEQLTDHWSRSALPDCPTTRCASAAEVSTAPTRSICWRAGSPTRGITWQLYGRRDRDAIQQRPGLHRVDRHGTDRRAAAGSKLRRCRGGG